MNIKKVKLFLIILLALLSVTGVFVALIPAVYADPSAQATYTFGGGSGTSSSPYIISSIDHMNELADAVNTGETFDNKYFELAVDLQYSENWGEYYTQELLTPIGTSQNPFMGTFNGNNHYISNPIIHIDDVPITSEDYHSATTILGTKFAYQSLSIGIFGCVYQGSIKNLGIKNLQVKHLVDVYEYPSLSVSEIASINIGGVTGLSVGTSITNCIVNEFSVEYVSDSNLVGSVAETIRFYAGGIGGQIINSTMSGCLAQDVYFDIAKNNGLYATAFRQGRFSGIANFDDIEINTSKLGSSYANISQCLVNNFDYEYNAIYNDNFIYNKFSAGGGATSAEVLNSYCVQDNPTDGYRKLGWSSQNKYLPLNNRGIYEYSSSYWYYDNRYYATPQLRTFLNWKKYVFEINSVSSENMLMDVVEDMSLDSASYTSIENTYYSAFTLGSVNLSTSANIVTIKDDIGTITITAYTSLTEGYKEGDFTRWRSSGSNKYEAYEISNEYYSYTIYSNINNTDSSVAASGTYNTLISEYLLGIALSCGVSNGYQNIYELNTKRDGTGVTINETDGYAENLAIYIIWVDTVYTIQLMSMGGYNGTLQNLYISSTEMNNNLTTYLSDYISDGEDAGYIFCGFGTDLGYNPTYNDLLVSPYNTDMFYNSSYTESMMIYVYWATTLIFEESDFEDITCSNAGTYTALATYNHMIEVETTYTGLEHNQDFTISYSFSDENGSTKTITYSVPSTYYIANYKYLSNDDKNEIFFQQFETEDYDGMSFVLSVASSEMSMCPQLSVRPNFVYFTQDNLGYNMFQGLTNFETINNYTIAIPFDIGDSVTIETSHPVGTKAITENYISIVYYMYNSSNALIGSVVYDLFAGCEITNLGNITGTITDSTTISPTINEMQTYTISFKDVDGLEFSEGVYDFEVYEGTKIEITVDSTNQIYYSFFDAGNCEDYTVWYVPNGFVEYDIISPKDGETIIVTGETEIYPVIKKLVRVELQYDEDGIVLLGAFDISEGDDLTFNQQLLRLYNCQDFSKYLEIEVSEGYKFVRLDIVETDTGNIADLTDVDCDITITAVFTK